MAQGWVYALVNPAFPGLVKIGMTEGSVEIRARQLYTTGVPFPYVILHKERVSDARAAERALHTHLDAARVHAQREHFVIEHIVAIDILSRVAAQFPVTSAIQTRAHVSDGGTPIDGDADSPPPDRTGFAAAASDGIPDADDVTEQTLATEAERLQHDEERAEQRTAHERMLRRLSQRSRELMGCESSISAIAYDRSGGLLAATGRFGVRVFDASTGVSLYEWREERGHNDIAFLPQREAAITIDASELRVWTFRANHSCTPLIRTRWDLLGRRSNAGDQFRNTWSNDYLSCFATNSDGSMFAVGMGNGSLLLSDPDARPLTRVAAHDFLGSIPGIRRLVRGHTEAIRSVLFAMNGQSVVTANRTDGIRVWALNGNLIHAIKNVAPPLALNSRGDLLAATSKRTCSTKIEYFVHIIDVMTWRTVATVPVAAASDLAAVRFTSADRVAVAHRVVDVYALDGVRVQRIEVGVNPEHYPADITSLATHPNARVIAVGDAAGYVRQWALA